MRRRFRASTVQMLLFAALFIGVVIRILAWDPGDEGVFAWIGGLLVEISIVGLIVLQIFKERAGRTRKQSFWFDPYWKYGLLLVAIVAVAILGITRPEGALVMLSAALFWVAVIALIVRLIGRLILGWRGHDPKASPKRPPSYVKSSSRLLRLWARIPVSGLIGSLVGLLMARVLIVPSNGMGAMIVIGLFWLLVLALLLKLIIGIAVDHHRWEYACLLLAVLAIPASAIFGKETVGPISFIVFMAGMYGALMLWLRSRRGEARQ